MMVSLYIGQWRFNADGILKPRFGFEAVNNLCVCNPHKVYKKNNELEEYNDPPILGSSNWHVIRHESKKPRNPANNREWGTKKTAAEQRLYYYSWH